MQDQISVLATPETEKVIGEATPEQIAKWKAQYGQVFQYTVENRTCYLRSVDRNVYSLATVKMSSAPSKFSETIIEGIWLGGDDELRKNDRYYFALIDFTEELMAKKKGNLSIL